MHNTRLLEKLHPTSQHHTKANRAIHNDPRNKQQIIIDGIPAFNDGSPTHAGRKLSFSTDLQERKLSTKSTQLFSISGIIPRLTNAEYFLLTCQMPDIVQCTYSKAAELYRIISSKNTYKLIYTRGQIHDWTV